MTAPRRKPPHKAPRKAPAKDISAIGLALAFESNKLLSMPATGHRCRFLRAAIEAGYLWEQGPKGHVVYPIASQKKGFFRPFRGTAIACCPHCGADMVGTDW
jgi:hypothetical protein